ncbi:DUF4259 domain-containing protein [Kitasatospora purpeofusca]|uniref:DUF4259 domain-containing protein n=1 Tax=Kitasatospora purpeofusca TaxID=67352 RepID=UPI002E0DF4F4|nr:DUF4259 domain-containing protein [Kitasatospora purpeofusca]
MGTWDIGHFDNDSAADFCAGLDEAAAGEREGVVRRALTLAADTGADDYLDYDEAVEAVAAAALVASQCPDGVPVTSAYGPDQPLPVFAADLRPLAAAALDRVVAEESELAELWDEGGEGAAWRRTVRELRDVLAPVPGPAPEALFELP